jgi:hypothetical protein
MVYMFFSTSELLLHGRSIVCIRLEMIALGELVVYPRPHPPYEKSEYTFALLNLHFETCMFVANRKQSI